MTTDDAEEWDLMVMLLPMVSQFQRTELRRSVGRLFRDRYTLMDTMQDGTGSSWVCEHCNGNAKLPLKIVL